MVSDKKPMFSPHENNIMKIRAIIADIDALKEQLAHVENGGNRPVESLNKARSNLMATIVILKSV